MIAPGLANGVPLCEGISRQNSIVTFRDDDIRPVARQTAMEEHVPRAPWRRRRAADSPRPAGRRWAGRLRRSGSLARRVLLVRVGRRRPDAGRRNALVLPGSYTGSDLVAYSHSLARFDRMNAVRAIAPPPVAPAIEAPVIEAPLESAAPVPLLPGERTRARRMRFALVNACTLASLGL